ncbi:triple QxxK/R motif-containing protein isoform X1 [Octopus sinensis]|uniref:Triple QxxK/R motif-containing protein n=1 Tax=Octopus sinensis TaxID=2607531 RepID=A0A7E6FHD2_9MOLL|nr:triple QxxK/R motif-containing protein isoform X1 [Octopus sinensis]
MPCSNFVFCRLEIALVAKNMAKKDSQASHVSAGEQHRKQIGKENFKKAKKDNKEVKKKSDLKKSSMPITDVILVVFSILVIIAAVYLFLFWYLSQEPESVTTESKDL